MKTEHNRNYQRIESAIINAYNQLLKERGTPDVTITELCKRAKINRTTFYKHHKGVHEITDYLEDQLIFNLFNIDPKEKLGMEEFMYNPRPALDRLNNNLLANLEYYKSLLRPDRICYIISKTTALLVEDFKTCFPKLAKNPKIMKKVKINISNFIGSVASLYIQWMNGYLDCELKDITDYLCHVLNKIYQGIKIPE